MLDEFHSPKESSSFKTVNRILILPSIFLAVQLPSISAIVARIWATPKSKDRNKHKQRFNLYRLIVNLLIISRVRCFFHTRKLRRSRKSYNRFP